MATGEPKTKMDASSGKRLKAVAAFQLAAKASHKTKTVEAETQETKREHAVDETILKKDDFDLSPPTTLPPDFADFPCIETLSDCVFPMPGLQPTQLNVNAGHGGGTALMLFTRVAYKGSVKLVIIGESEGSDVMLLRCGYDGNHFSGKSLIQAGEHSIYNYNELMTDSAGRLQPKILYGRTRGMILTNMARYGHGGCGVLFDGPSGSGSTSPTTDDDDGDDHDDDPRDVFVPEPQISTRCDTDGACLFVICSAEAMDNNDVPCQCYLVHFQLDGKLKQVPLKADGKDLWKFGSEDDALKISGPPGSHYAIFHSKSSDFTKTHQDKPIGNVLFTQEHDGNEPTNLFGKVSRFSGRSLLLLCSNSFGDEDQTTSALYQVAIGNGKVDLAYITGLASGSQSSDVWAITLTDQDDLVVTGPDGPCRYAIYSNIPDDTSDASLRCLQSGCLATGSPAKILGELLVEDDTIKVWVDQVVKVRVTVNGCLAQAVGKSDWSEQPDGRFAFRRGLSEDEKRPGLQFWRAFATLKTKSGTETSVELDGSPRRVIRQPEGVAFALNCGGPAYQDLSNVVFDDTHTMFKESPEKGIELLRKFWYHTPRDESLHAVIGNTYNTFLHSSYNETHAGFVDEVKFEFPIKAGDYTLRLYSVSKSMMSAAIGDHNAPPTSEPDVDSDPEADNDLNEGNAHEVGNNPDADEDACEDGGDSTNVEEVKEASTEDGNDTSDRNIGESATVDNQKESETACEHGPPSAAVEDTSKDEDRNAAADQESTPEGLVDNVEGNAQDEKAVQEASPISAEDEESKGQSETKDDEVNCGESNESEGGDNDDVDDDDDDDDEDERYNYNDDDDDDDDDEGCNYLNASDSGSDFESHMYDFDSAPELERGRFTSKVLQQLKAIPDTVEGLTAKVCEVPITVGDNGVSLYFQPNGGNVEISGFLVYDEHFKEPKQTPEEVQQETKTKQELADKLQPLGRTYAMKEMKIAGWSANLLENASGEMGTMSHWNYGGDFKIADGGDGTEKMFKTSYVTCTKSQEIDLTRHFSEKHLDSAPEIQVGESFREGDDGGGYYTFTVTLSDQEGTTIAQYDTDGEKACKTKGWIRESHSFKDYGPGVRNLTFESSGHDEKFWAGYFGAWMSAAVVRVKTEVSAASDDAFADIPTGKTDERKHETNAFLRDLASKYKEEMEQTLATVSNESGDENNSQVQEKPTTDSAASHDVGKAETKTETTATMPTKAKVTSTRKKKREVRIFVSSTFLDFQEEREVIIKKVFRELNRLCLDRGVFFTYVDLRWGITEKQSQSGRTIAICLREVDKCRPYFICLMGDRYGWSQTEVTKDELLNKSYTYACDNHQNLKWIDHYRFGSSVTKLEVLYAAIRPHKDNRNDRIYFYLREPRVVREELPAPVQKDDKEKPKGETQWHFDQQHTLRKFVLDSGHTCKLFQGATDVSVMIKDDLMRCIDEDYPPGTNLSNLEREQEAHIAFAEARRRVYIGGQRYFDFIDGFYTEHNARPLTIIGESGSGKSALVANWCGRFEEKNPGTFLFMHFIGSSAESASYLNVLRRLYNEMKQFYDLDMEVPTSDRNLVIDLPSWLKIAGNRSKVMIVLDALNQLDSGAGGSGDGKDLKWISFDLPVNVHMLLSTLPGETQDAINEFGWPSCKVEPLQECEKMEIITGYMDIYAKTLNQEQTNLIINAKQSSNPLYLKALLDEVRVYGSFYQLTSAIKSYLKADNPGDLFGKILERLEHDFEEGDISRPHLVRDTTTAIWCSQRGMSENELLTLLKIPSLVWSPFYLSLEENLINKNGVLNFFHDHLRQAVERRYMPTEEDKKEQYLKLANFFNGQDIDERYVDELPYLLSQAGELKRLKATILNVLVFKIMMKTEDGRFELIKAWRQLGGFEQVEQAYLDVLSRSEAWAMDAKDKVQLIECMAIFFTQLGLLRGARLLNERLLKELEAMHISQHSMLVHHHSNYSIKHRCNHPAVIDVLIALGNVSRKEGNLDDANGHLEDALSRLTKATAPEQKLQLVKALIGVGSVRRQQGQLDFAKKILQRALEVIKEVVGQDHHYTAAIVGQLGELCYVQSRLVEAIVYHAWDLQQTQKYSGLDHPHVAAILNNIGLVQDDMQDKSAEKTFKLALGILLEAYGKDHVDVATIRYNLGARFFGNNMYQRARYQFQEAHRVFGLFLGNHPHTRSAQQALTSVEELCA